jgi:hypothetical protein
MKTFTLGDNNIDQNKKDLLKKVFQTEPSCHVYRNEMGERVYFARNCEVFSKDFKTLKSAEKWLQQFQG